MQSVLTAPPLPANSISELLLAAELEWVNPLADGSRWDNFVLAHPDATIFHSSAWARVLNKTYGHQPFYFRLFSPAGSAALVPLMEIRSAFTGRRGICMPFSDCCAPLISDVNGSSMAQQQLLSLARERKWKYVEVRGGDERMPLSASPAATFYGHSLCLAPSLEEIWLRCSSSVRRGIRKAAKAGVKVTVTDEPDSILEFFKLHSQTRRRHGLPPQSLKFFLSIYREVISAGLGFVVLARKKSRVVAAAIFFKFGRNALYKFGASDHAFQELRGNNVTMWEGIKHLAGSACGRLHMGRTALDNEGLRRFKQGWGTTEEMLHYFTYDLAIQNWKKEPRSGMRFHHKFFENMPLAVNRLAGALIYPHLD
jgi:hypothetical protein